MDILDMTLRMWLLEKLDAEEMQSIDIPHLSAVDITLQDRSIGTLADTVEKNSFEQIRVVPKRFHNLGEIDEIIHTYYVGLGFRLQQRIGGGAIGLIYVKGAESSLITFFFENDQPNTVVNVTVNGPTGFVE